MAILQHPKLCLRNSLLCLFLLCITEVVKSQRIISARFVDGKTDDFIPWNVIGENNTIDYDTVGTVKLNVLLKGSPKTRSVFLILDKPAISFCERQAPFAVFRNTWARGGPHGIGKYRGRRLPEGARNLTAIPYDGEKCLGNAGPKFEYIMNILPQQRHTLAPIPAPLTEAPTTAPTMSESLQPKVTTVESLPAQKLAGILNLGDKPTPWCNGHPTYWTPGHRASDDTPNCYVDGNWTRPYIAHMDDNDDLNDIDGPEVIDRHDCGVVDVNNDGNPDLYCLVGADGGQGDGYNELYLTNPDGSLLKVPTHALQKYTTMRGRYTTVLNDRFIMIANKGVVRTDGRPNEHRMFQVTGQAPDFFEEVEGPWIKHTNSSFCQSVDFNRDGLEDVFIGNRQDYPLVYLQQPPDESGKTTWEEVFWDTTRRQRNWRTARVADFTGDGIPDLLVVNFGHRGYLRVFVGIPEAPFFDFTGRLYYHTSLPYAAPDVEVFDVNGDGLLDFYVVQSDESTHDAEGLPHVASYCGGKFVHHDWWHPFFGNQPPSDFIPPNDTAPDFLFINKGSEMDRPDRFEKLKMEHSMPGCGNLVRPFGDKKLLLTQGGFVRPGHQLMLEWE